jgi:hypothetical protein
MYYLMSEKNEWGQEIVNSQRYVTTENRHTVLHTFDSWDAVWEYMIAPEEWKKRNLGNAE